MQNSSRYLLFARFYVANKGYLAVESDSLAERWFGKTYDLVWKYLVWKSKTLSFFGKTSQNVQCLTQRYVYG